MNPDDIRKLMEEMPADIADCINWDEINKMKAEAFENGSFEPLGGGMFGAFGPNDAPHALHSIPDVIHPGPIIGTVFGNPICAKPMDADAEYDEIMRAERESS